MHHYDVFNGDADGLCALHQLRLAHPAEATLITGVKRDIALLERFVPVPGSRVTVLDVSMDTNRTGLLRVLEAGCQVLYVDHHHPGEPLAHPALEAHIDRAPDVCTALLVHRYLGEPYPLWAITAAFGDNMAETARRVAQPLRLADADLQDLQTLGELLNYNGYGSTLADLHFHPADLYLALRPHEHPLDFLRNAPQAAHLREGFEADLAQALGIQPLLSEEAGQVVQLPDEAWARRIMGVFANRLASEAPDRATALLTENPDGSLRISVRAPMARPEGADTLCRRFPTGGGRAGAGGVSSLPPGQLGAFLDAFRAQFSA